MASQDEFQQRQFFESNRSDIMNIRLPIIKKMNRKLSDFDFYLAWAQPYFVKDDEKKTIK